MNAPALQPSFTIQDGGWIARGFLGELRRNALPHRAAGVAQQGRRPSFTPRELAEMRVMVKLRALGLPLPEARKVAEKAAPGTIFAALANHPEKALAVDGPADVAGAYLKSLEDKSDEGYLQVLSDLPATERGYRFAVIKDGRCSLLKELNDESVDEDVEVAGLINLWAVARAIVEAAPRPLFTLVVPRNFRSG